MFETSTACPKQSNIILARSLYASSEGTSPNSCLLPRCSLQLTAPTLVEKQRGRTPRYSSISVSSCPTCKNIGSIGCRWQSLLTIFLHLILQLVFQSPPTLAPTLFYSLSESFPVSKPDPRHAEILVPCMKENNEFEFDQMLSASSRYEDNANRKH